MSNTNSDLSLDLFQKKFLNSTIKKKVEEDLFNQIRPGGTIASVEDALNVHREGYIARLTESLGEIYESTWWVLGDDDFFSLCRRFIFDHPSTYYNLTHYGEEFPFYLENSNHIHEFPFLADLANFEWHISNLFHSQEGPVIDDHLLLSIEQNPNQYFAFNESFFLFESAYNVLPLWRLRKEEHYPESMDEYLQPQWIYAYKLNNKLYFKNITPHQYNWVESLLSGLTLSELLNWAEQICPLSECEIEEIFFLLKHSQIVRNLISKGQQVS